MFGGAWESEPTVIVAVSGYLISISNEPAGTDRARANIANADAGYQRQAALIALAFFWYSAFTCRCKDARQTQYQPVDLVKCVESFGHFYGSNANEHE